MIITASIQGYDGVFLLLKPQVQIDRELLQKQPKIIEMRLVDGREISAEQRKKIYAILQDICDFTGDTLDYAKLRLKEKFCVEKGKNGFSLADIDKSTAKDFIEWLIGFCFENNIPTKDTLLNRCEDIDRYLYMCLEHRKCAICNKKAEVHHVDRIGMGRDRNKVCHVGMKAIALCREHHSLIHENEKAMFNKYHIYEIPLDNYLCDKLNLKGNENGNENSNNTERA